MDDRVRELAKRNERIWNLYSIGPVQRAEVEEFTESILQECIKLAGTESDRYYAMDEWELALVMENYQALLKKHFEL